MGTAGEATIMKCIDDLAFDLDLAKYKMIEVVAAKPNVGKKGIVSYTFAQTAPDEADADYHDYEWCVVGELDKTSKGGYSHNVILRVWDRLQAETFVALFKAMDEAEEDDLNAIVAEGEKTKTAEDGGASAAADDLKGTDHFDERFHSIC